MFIIFLFGQNYKGIINTLTLEIHTQVFDEYGGELSANKRFSANRISRVLTRTDFDDGVEIFMWPENYDFTPSPATVYPFSDEIGAGFGGMKG